MKAPRPLLHRAVALGLLWVLPAAAAATQARGADTKPPTIVIVDPIEGRAVSASGPLVVSGGVVDASPVTVEVAGVPAKVKGRVFEASLDAAAIEALGDAPGGRKRIAVVARDEAGNVSEAAVVVVLDRHAPAVHITSPRGGAVVGRGMLTVEGTLDDPAAFVEVNGHPAEVAGSRFRTDLPLVHGGSLQVRATARDAAGRSGSDAVTVSVDAGPPAKTGAASKAVSPNAGTPAIELTAPARGFVTRDAVLVEGTVRGAAPVALTLDGVAVPVKEGRFSYPVVLAQEGPVTLHLAARDASGNESTADVDGVVDRTPPRLTVVSSGAALSGTVQDATRVKVIVGGVTARVIGSAWAATVEGLGEGAQAVDVVAEDAAGNRATTTRDVVVDHGAPVVAVDPSASAGLTRAATVRVTGTVVESSLASVRVNGVAAKVVPDGSGAWRFEATLPLAEGDNAIVVTARDGGGRTGSASVPLTRDSLLPAVSLKAPSRVAPGQTVRVEASAYDEGGIARVDIYAQGQLVASRTEPPYAAEFTVPAGTANGTTLVLKAEATDRAGNMAEAMQGADAAEAGVVVGQVLHDVTSLPLPGATVRLLSEVAPDATSDDRGRYVLPASESLVVIQASKAGMTSVERTSLVTPEVGTVPVDARLTPLASPTVIGTGGGSLQASATRPSQDGTTSMDVVVDVPPGAVASPTSLRLTALSPQGLPGLLPLGYGPAVAFDLRADGTATVSGTLGLSLTALPSGTLHLVSYSTTLHAWLMAASALEATGGALTTTLPGLGSYALVSEDETDPPLAVPAPGQPLPSAAFAAIPSGATSTSVVVPPTLPPTGGTARGSLVLSSPEALPSGTVVQAEVRETFTLTSGEVVSEQVRNADLLLYRESPPASSALRGDMPMTPSQVFEPTDLVTGEVYLRVLSGREDVRGTVAGTGPVTVVDGDAMLQLPAGAVPPETVVSLDATELSPDVPGLAGVTPIAEVVVGLSGQTAAMPGELSVSGAGVPAGETLFLAHVERVASVNYFSVVALATLTSGRVVTAEGAGLPGVRREGRYVFFRTSRGVGFVAGVVSSGSGPIAALVQSQSLPFVGISGGDGAYKLLTEAGSAALTARVPGTALAGSGTVLVTAGATAVLDLLLTGAQTVATVVPTDGSTGLPTSTPVEIHTTAAMQEGSITAASVRLLKLPAETAVALHFQLSASGKLLLAIPEAGLAPDTEYRLSVAGLLDVFGAAVVVPPTTFRTADDAPPTYDTKVIVFSFPDSNGNIHVTAPAGSLPPGMEVLIIDSGNGVVVTFTVGNDGSLAGQFPGTLADRLLVTITDPLGNVTTFERSQYQGADGSTAVNSGGGVVEGPGGVQLRLPEGAAEQPVRLKIASFDENALPGSQYPGLGLDPQGNPIAHFGSGLKIESPDLPVFKKEVDLAFPLPEGLPENPNDAFFYVYRRLLGPNGEIVQQALDQAFVEGEGATAKVVTASPPFSGYVDSLGGFTAGPLGAPLLQPSISAYTFLMWTYDQTIPGKAKQAVITGQVLKTVWPQGASQPHQEPVEETVTLKAEWPLPPCPPPLPQSQCQVSPVLTTATTTGGYALLDSTFHGGTVNVTATYTKDGVTHSQTVTGVMSDPSNWQNTSLRYYTNIAVANVTFPLEDAPPSPTVGIALVRTDTNETVTTGIVPLGTPLKAVIHVTNGDVAAVRLDGDGCNVTYPESPSQSEAEVDLTPASGCPTTSAGAYVLAVDAQPETGATVTEVRTFLVVPAGGGNTVGQPGVAPGVIDVEPPDGSVDIPASILPQIVFSEPVAGAAGKVHLRKAAGTEVSVGILASLSDGSVFTDPLESLPPPPAAQVVALMLRPENSLEYGAEYRIEIDEGIHDLSDPLPLGALPAQSFTFTVFQPGPVGGTEETFTPVAIAVVDHRAFVAETFQTHLGNVRSFDISDPVTPTEIPSATQPVFQRPVDLTGEEHDQTLAVGTTVTGVSEPSNLYVMDVSDPLETRWDGITSVSNSAVDGTLVRTVKHGPFIYVLTNRKGVQVVDVEKARQAFQDETGGEPYSVGYFHMLIKMRTTGVGQTAIVGTIPYPVNGTEQWTLFDMGIRDLVLAGAKQPVALSVGYILQLPANDPDYDQAHPANNVNLSYLLVGNPQTQERVAKRETRAPDGQKLVARKLGLGRVVNQELAVVGGLGSFGPGGEQRWGIRIYDVTDVTDLKDKSAPDPPKQVARGFLVMEPSDEYSGDITDIQVRDGLALVAGTKGVAIVNLQNPDNPFQAGVLNGLGGRLAFSADGHVLGTDGGIKVGNLEPPQCPSLATLLTPEVVIKEVRDPANGTFCGDDGALVFRLCKAAKVTLHVNGGVPYQGQVDEGPLGSISDLPLQPGTHWVRLPREEFDMDFDQKAFELTAADENGASETHEGTIETDLRNRSVLPVGHTLVKGVDTLDGHLVRQSTDLKIPGRHLGLEVTRTYSSAAKGADGTVGAGWSWNYASQLTPTGCGLVSLSTPDGSSQVFRSNAAGVYTPQKGYHGRLEVEAGTYVYTDKSGTRYFYRQPAGPPPDETRRLDYVEEPHGDQLQMSYDGSGRLVRVAETHREATEITVRSIEIAYTPGPKGNFVRIESIQAPTLGLKVSYEYDDKGNLITATRSRMNIGDQPDAPADRVEGYEYTNASPRDPHQMTAAIDANTNRTEFHYLGAGDPFPGTPPNTLIVSNEEYVKTVVEKPGGSIPDYETLFEYEPRSPVINVTRVRDPRLNLTQYSLNGNGSPTEILEAKGTPDERKTEMDWKDSDILKEHERDAELRDTYFDYDPNGNMIEERIEKDSVGLLKTTYVYHPTFNKLTLKTVEDPLPPGNRATHYEIDDANGDLLWMTDAEGNKTVYSYASGGAGLLTQVTSPRGHVTTHSNHDSFGNARQVQDPEGNQTSRDYDLRGRLTHESDSFGRDTTTLYDGLDRPVRVTRLAGDGQVDPVTETDYYANGEPQEVRRKVRAPGEWVVTEYNLDGLNRVTSTVTTGFGLQGAVSAAITYDPNGNRKTETDRRGVVRRMEYDPLNRLKQVFIDAGPDPNGPIAKVAEYSYDKVGNKLTEADINGFVTSYAYDGLYRVVKKTLAEPRSSGPEGGSGNYEEIYAYDRSGNRTSAKDANGKETRFEYDRLNRVTAVVRDAGPGGKQLRTTTTYADPEQNARVNKTEELDVARGLRTTFTHDKIDRELTRTLRLEGEDGDGTPAVLSYETKTDYIDGAEHAVEVEDPLHNKTYARMDKLDRPVQQIVDRLGLALETLTSYDGLGNKASVRDPRQNTSYSQFDGLGRLTKTTDALAKDALYTYDGEGLKRTETDRRGVRKTFDYDNLGRPTRSALDLTAVNISNVPWSHETHYVDGAAPKRIEKDAKGTQTFFDLDKLGRVVKTTDFFGNYTATRWDGVNRREERDKLGNTTHLAYDGLNRVLLVTDPVPFEAQTVVTTYDDASNRVQERDRRGILKITQSDSLGRVRSVARRPEAAPPASAVVLERNEYDGNGNKTLALDADGHTTGFDYDAANRLVRRTEGLQAPAAERVVTEYRYDQNGNKTKDIDGRSSEAVPAMKYGYDALNRVADSWNGEGEKTHHGYDEEGNRTLVQEPKLPLQTTEYHYDELGKLLKVTQMGGRETEYGYDPNRNRVSQKDANDNVVEMTYDELGRLDLLKQKGLPGGDLVTDHGYDANGNETSLTDPKGQQVVNTYDKLNRLDLRVYVAALPADLAQLWRHTTKIDYDYDQNNNLTDSKEYVTSGSDPPPAQPNLLTHRVYDNLDRLQSETSPLPVNPLQSVTVTYAYNLNGTRRSVIDDAGSETRYTYDAVNRMASATTAFGTPQAKTTGYTYWPDNLLKDVSFPNGVTAHHEYDGADRLLSVANAGSAAVSSYAYTYDDNGNRLTQDEINGGATEHTAYTYDELNRLDTVTYPADATFPQGRLVDYGYDDVGNRTGEVTKNAVTNAVLTSKVGHFDVVNRLTELTDSNPAQTLFFGYDKNGNQTTKTVGTGTPSLFRYDIRDRLLEVQSGPSGPILSRFQYDAAGRRTQKIGDDGIVQYVYDDTSTFLEFNELGSRVAKYDYGSDRLISLTRINEPRKYYSLDGLRSVVSLTTDTGSTAANYHLDAWGNYRFPSELTASHNRFGFTGHIYDAETKLWFAKARFYDPTVGRFTSQDSFLGNQHEPPSLHRYTYAYANPGRYVDPTGHLTWEGFKVGLKNTPRALAEPVFWVFDTTLAIGGRAMDIPTEYLPLQSALAHRQLQRLEAGQSGRTAALKGAIETPAAVFSFGVTSFVQGQGEAYQEFSSGKITLDEYDNRLSQIAGGQTGAAVVGAGLSRATGGTWTGRVPTNTTKGATVVESRSQIPGAAEPAAPDTPLYHYTDKQGLGGIEQSGKILASDGEVPWGVNPEGISDAGIFDPGRGMGTRSNSPNVFFTDVPPAKMTPALAAEMGIRSTKGVVSMPASEAQGQGIPVYRSPHHPNVYNAVGDAVTLPVPPSPSADAAAAVATAPKGSQGDDDRRRPR